jgi:hypothetical protein
MGMPRVQEDGLQLRAGLVFGFQEPNPHKVRVMVNYHQAIAQAVQRGNVNRTPEVTRKMLKRGCRYVRCCAILRGGGGLIQIARLTVEVLYRARHGRYRGGIM